MSELSQAPDNICFVVDAAFYDSNKLASLDDVYWITRVPGTLKESKHLLRRDYKEFTWKYLCDDYHGVEICRNIFNVEQRWLMVHSKHAYARDLKKFENALLKEFARVSRALWHISNKIFSCDKEAIAAVKELSRRTRHYCIDFHLEPQTKYLGKGRPPKDAVQTLVGVKVVGHISSDLERINRSRNSLGRFILATNQLCEEQISSSAMLQEYKEQSSVESGFKFIKDNAFELDSIFLKTPKRIGSLMMIMTLCLLVYNFAQYHIRACLKDNDDVLPNQLGKPVQNPTMKWIAEMMVVIAVVHIDSGGESHRIVTNVNQVHKKIIAYFGAAAKRIYGLADDYQQTPIHYDNYKNFINWCEK